MSTHILPKNTSMRDAVRWAIDRGFSVCIPRRTGEYLFVAPDGDRKRVNGRKKDAGRKLLSFLRKYAT